MNAITPQEALQRTIEHREIFHDEMLHLMRMIMRGELSPVMTAAIVTGLRVKKETIGEISAAAEVMREFSNKVQVHDKANLVDIVGTGGDGANTFNISTCSTFVIAAAGGKVSKQLTLPFPNVEFQALLTEIAAAKPDAVFSFFAGAGAVKFVK
ncbi:MAG: hypothetical protein RR855_03665, partial [Comamonas sp.]